MTSLRASNNYRQPRTPKAFLRALGRRTDPLQGTCAGCTAAQIAGEWRQASENDPQDALYKEFSVGWAGVEVQHTTNPHYGGSRKEGNSMINQTEQFLNNVGYLCDEYLNENGGEAIYDELRNHIVQETGFSLIDEDLKLAIRTYEGGE